MHDDLREIWFILASMPCIFFSSLQFHWMWVSSGDNWFYKYNSKTPCPQFIQKKKKHWGEVFGRWWREDLKIAFISMSSSPQSFWSERSNAVLKSWNTFIITHSQCSWEMRPRAGCMWIHATHTCHAHCRLLRKGRSACKTQVVNRKKHELWRCCHKGLTHITDW